MGGLALLLILGLTTHAPLLRTLARAMIVDGPAPSDAWVLVLDGDYRFDRAVDLHQAGAAPGVLFVDPPATRLVRSGVVPSRKEQCLRELGRRGVSPGEVTALPGNDKTPWQIAHALEAWLVEHPTARILVLCERFAGRDLRFVVSKVMHPTLARRVAFRGLPDHRYDETNWWRNRAGVRALAGAAFDLAYDALHGEDAPTVNEFDPDKYERDLRAAISGK